MKILGHGIIVLAISIGVATAGIPPVPCSRAMPWDDYGHALVTPGPGSEGGVGEVEVFVCYDDEPVAGADVAIDLSDCQHLCINPGDAGLAGITDSDGIVILNPQVGGCEDCNVIIRANGITIRTYFGIKSTDWNGDEADGIVGVSDFAFFATAFKVTQDECADYNGDGAVNGTDFALFATSFRRLDENPAGCE